MKFPRIFRSERPESHGFKTIPIPEVPQEIQEKFRQKKWREIPVLEDTTREPKHLTVIPNLPKNGG